MDCRLICSIVCIAALSGPGLAQTTAASDSTENSAEPYTLRINASRPNSLVLAMHELGFRAKLTEDGQGDPKIESGASGVNFSIYFYGCDDDNGGCQDVLFSTSFNFRNGFKEKPINDWNEGKVIGAAFLDDENDPGIQHFVAGINDMSLESFDRTMERWEVALDDFQDFINW